MQIVQRLQCFEVNVYLAFIVSGAAGINIAIANGGLERRSGPKVKRLGRLNIVVAVKKDRGFARSIERLSVHERVQGGRYDFTRLKSGETQVVSDPASSAVDVRLVCGL